MAMVAPRRGLNRVFSSLTAEDALRWAWGLWVIMLALPFVLFLAAVWNLMGVEEGEGRTELAMVWFLISMGFLGVMGPAAFFWRGHVFKEYWQGRVLSPRDYLVGMLGVWVTLEAGGIFALVGCLVSQTLLPNLLAALVAFMLFVPMWPSGRAMHRAVGGAEDPEIYTEPR